MYVGRKKSAFTGIIFYYRDLWDHMSKMAAALQHMSETMKIMPHSSYLSVKELVASPSWKYIHNCPDRKNTHMPTKIDITEDESTEISGGTQNKIYVTMYHKLTIPFPFRLAPLPD